MIREYAKYFIKNKVGNNASDFVNEVYRVVESIPGFKEVKELRLTKDKDCAQATIYFIVDSEKVYHEKEAS